MHHCFVHTEVRHNKNAVELMVAAVKGMRKIPEVDELLSKHEEAFAKIYNDEKVRH